MANVVRRIVNALILRLLFLIATVCFLKCNKIKHIRSGSIWLLKNKVTSITTHIWLSFSLCWSVNFVCHNIPLLNHVQVRKICVCFYPIITWQFLSTFCSAFRSFSTKFVLLHVCFSINGWIDVDEIRLKDNTLVTVYRDKRYRNIRNTGVLRSRITIFELHVGEAKQQWFYNL